MMSSAVYLLDSDWDLLRLREKNHRLYIHLILMAKTCMWSELIMPEKLALVDPEDYDGHRMQIQTICTAGLRRDVDKVPQMGLLSLEKSVDWDSLESFGDP